MNNHFFRGIVVTAALFSTLFKTGNLVAQPAPKPIRALLVTGGCCHDYTSQKEIIAKGLASRAFIQVDAVQQGGTATDSRIELYQSADWSRGYDIVIHDECFADVKETNWTANILNPHKKGLPAVVLHCAMHSYRDGTDEWFKFCGVTSWRHGAAYPHSVLNRDALHPVMLGAGPAWFNPEGELYWIDKLWPDARPLAAAKNQENGKEEICVWVNHYNQKTRVFGTTLGHHNSTVESDAYLDLLTRGVLWACDRLSPEYLKPSKPVQIRKNSATGKKATASSEQSGNSARNAFDDNPGTRWCADNAEGNHWLQVDLGKTVSLTGCEIEWEQNDSAYQYRIETSGNGVDWKPLINAPTNSVTGRLNHDFQIETRYMKVTFLGSSSGGWGSIREWKMFAGETVTLDPEVAVLHREKEILDEVKIPEGFEKTLFAAPPAVNYPVFVAAAPDGTVYVASDGNGSLDRKAWKGSIYRLRDLDGDGRADESKLFVSDVDSPRGLVWDHDRLFLMHPPHLSAFIDHNGDGIADEQKILVKNIAFGFKDRPADHTSNGVELGVDGWLYLAIGDFGFLDAEGTDGRHLTFRGGGVVRVRPDGTGLEVYSRGTRNILEVAVSPLLDGFARDNTNDGDGWDIRLHHFTGLEHHGYPSLYKNFTNEMVQPLADYGGGSGCGAMFLDEPGFPDDYGYALYTADWGRDWIYRHRVSPRGATFAADQKEFIKAQRVTDLDVDASSRIYAASWKGATFTYAGENVGYLVQVKPKGYVAEPLPDFIRATDDRLISLLESPSHRRRLEAQRELIRRGIKSETTAALSSLIGKESAPLAGRVAALFALQQIHGQGSYPLLEKFMDQSSIRSYVLRAIGNEPKSGVPPARIIAALKDSNPVVRREALFALARTLPAISGSKESPELIQAQAAISGLFDDADPVVVHTAVQAAIVLQSENAAFALLDRTDVSPRLRSGALQVLQATHKSEVITGLLDRVEKEKNEARRRDLLTSLARLNFTEGRWKGDSWGTRPDTSGPYYQTDAWEETGRISSYIRKRINESDAAESAFLFTEASRFKIPMDDQLNRMAILAKEDASLVTPLLNQILRAQKADPKVLTFVEAVASSKSEPVAHKVLALQVWSKFLSAENLRSILSAYQKLAADQAQKAQIQPAYEALFNSPGFEKQIDAARVEAEKLETHSVWADVGLLNASTRRNLPEETKREIESVLETGWKNQARRIQLLNAATLARHKGSSNQVLLAFNSSEASLVAVAREAAKAIGIVLPEQAASEPLLADKTIEEILAMVMQAKGDAALGESVFERAACVTCHTVRKEDPLRGPFLGNISTIYKRRELAEAILVPSKSIAQGFAAYHFEMKDGSEVDGFVIQEAADKIVIRNVAGQELTLLPTEIQKRDKLLRSLMPEGLASALTMKEFASLLDYIEGFGKK